MFTRFIVLTIFAMILGGFIGIGLNAAGASLGLIAVSAFVFGVLVMTAFL